MRLQGILARQYCPVVDTACRGVVQGIDGRAQEPDVLGSDEGRLLTCGGCLRGQAHRHGTQVEADDSFHVELLARLREVTAAVRLTRSRVSVRPIE
jgi:hypothetical protein